MFCPAATVQKIGFPRPITQFGLTQVDKPGPRARCTQHSGGVDRKGGSHLLPPSQNFCHTIFVAKLSVL